MTGKGRRPAHILKQNKALERPAHFLFFDTESIPRAKGDKLVHDLYLIVGEFLRFDSKAPKGYSSTVFHTDDPGAFWCEVNRRVWKKTHLYCISHNISYDLVTSKALEILPTLGWQVVNYYDKNHTFHLEMKEGSRQLHFINLANFFQGKLEDIGKTFGLEKLELDYANPNPEEALVYCKRDVEIVKTAFLTWLDFIRDEDLGNFAVTAPGQAFNAYRHRFMRESIFIHNDEQALSLERAAYYGGRCEAYHIGEVKDGPIYSLDVNSMYPSVMTQHAFPVKLLGVKKGGRWTGDKALPSDPLRIADVLITTSEPVYPLRLKDRLVFPVGTFRTTLASPELDYALQHGHVTYTFSTAFYEKGYIFDDYVNYFYKQRETAKREGKAAYALLFKLMLNSLYGKFGQLSEIMERIGECPPGEVGIERCYSPKEGKFYDIKKVGGVVFREKEKGESFNSFPAIAATVTSYARQLLWYYILTAGRENVYYCDTDSLFVNIQGLERLQSFIGNEELGALKIADLYHSLRIDGLKDYTGDGKTTLKGIPPTAVRNDDGSFAYFNWPHLTTFLRSGQVSKYYNIKTIKRLHRVYTKGWVLENGDTVPFQMSYDGGHNCVIPFERTTYYHEGRRLGQPEQVEELRGLFL